MWPWRREGLGVAQSRGAMDLVSVGGCNFDEAWDDNTCFDLGLICPMRNIESQA